MPRKQKESTARTRRKLAMATSVAHKLNPLIALGFIFVYWVIGMNNVINPDVGL